MFRVLNLSTEFISFIENDTDISIKEDTIVKLCNFLDLDSDYMILKTGKIPSKYKKNIMSYPKQLAVYLKKYYDN